MVSCLNVMNALSKVARADEGHKGMSYLIGTSHTQYGVIHVCGLRSDPIPCDETSKEYNERRSVNKWLVCIPHAFGGDFSITPIVLNIRILFMRKRCGRAWTMIFLESEVSGAGCVVSDTGAQLGGAFKV